MIADWRRMAALGFGAGPAPDRASRMSRFRVCRPTFHAPKVGDMNRPDSFAAIDFPLRDVRGNHGAATASLGGTAQHTDPDYRGVSHGRRRSRNDFGRAPVIVSVLTQRDCQRGPGIVGGMNMAYFRRFGRRIPVPSTLAISHDLRALSADENAREHCAEADGLSSASSWEDIVARRRALAVASERFATGVLPTT
jgi:hypothetical protein